MVALVIILSGIAVLLAFSYLIVAHYILVRSMEDSIKKTPPDIRLLPFDPKKQL